MCLEKFKRALPLVVDPAHFEAFSRRYHLLKRIDMTPNSETDENLIHMFLDVLQHPTGFLKDIRRKST